MRVAVAVLSLLVASTSGAYSIGAESIGAGGFLYSTTDPFVSIGQPISDVNTGNLIDGYASASGASGPSGGYMNVTIANFGAAQSTYLAEKTWKSLVSDTIEDIQIDPGATELVIRLSVSAADKSDLVISPTFPNGYARTYVRATLRYYNQNSHTQGLGEILGVALAGRSVPEDWDDGTGDVSPAGMGYGSVSTFGASAQVELRIPASEVDADDTLLVAGQLYGEVKAGQFSGSFAASQLEGGGMSLEIIGGSGVPQNPIFLSAPEPDAALVGDVAMAGLLTIAARRRA